MKCLVFVKFLPEGSILPDEFFSRINAQWSYLGETKIENINFDNTSPVPSPKSGICISDYDSIQQLALDLAIMPGAGISNVEVFPILEEVYLQHLLTEIRE